jgi:hypothetical protein
MVLGVLVGLLGCNSMTEPRCSNLPLTPNPTVPDSLLPEPPIVTICTVAY